MYNQYNIDQQSHKELKFKIGFTYIFRLLHDYTKLYSLFSAGVKYNFLFQIKQDTMSTILNNKTISIHNRRSSTLHHQPIAGHCWIQASSTSRIHPSCRLTYGRPKLRFLLHLHTLKIIEMKTSSFFNVVQKHHQYINLTCRNSSSIFADYSHSLSSCHKIGFDLQNVEMLLKKYYNELRFIKNQQI